MRTIGRHWPKDAPRGDYPALCDICGVKWRRSQLYRSRSGLLVCPQDADDDRLPYIRAPHIQNNEGTGSEIAAHTQSDPLPVVL